MSVATILTEASDTELAIAVEDNLFALFRAMSILPGSALEQNEKLCYHLTFPLNPMFKGIWHTRLTAEEADTNIGETLDWFKTRSAPFVFWWVGPRTTPDDLPQRLQARGFAPNIVGDPGMAVRLRDLDDKVHTPIGFRIVQADNQKMLEDWRDAFVASFEIPLWAGQAWVDATLTAGILSAPWRLYIGYLDDKPVASNILFNGGGVASVYGVGTTPEARGKGIGTAITLQPLLDARTYGYHFGALFATEMGHPVYQRMGFHDVPCKIGRYLWISS